MKTRYSAVFALALAICVPAQSALAETTAVLVKATTTIKRAGVAAKVAEIKKERITEFVAKSTERLNRLLDREASIVIRIDAFLRKSEEKGKDVADAKAKLVDAKAALETAKTQVAGISAAAEKALAGTNMKEAFKTVQASVKAAHDGVKEVHEKIARAIKALGGNKEETATTTPKVQ